MTHPQESGHWYYPDGTPCFQVPNADGSRNITPTVHHARKLGLVPGITTIIRCAESWHLNRWKQREVAMRALHAERKHVADITIDGDGEEGWRLETDEELADRIIGEFGEESLETAKRGTEVHAALEARYQKGMPEIDHPYRPHVEGVDMLLSSLEGMDHFAWRAEVAFAHPDGFGSKSDLCCDKWVIDFKTKDQDRYFTEPRTYETHEMQLAATRYGLGEFYRNARCGIVYVDRRDEPLRPVIVAIPEDRLQRGLEMFQALLAYWKVKNRHDPSFATEAAR